MIFSKLFPIYAKTMRSGVLALHSVRRKVLGFARPFLRHGNDQASLALLIWLNESVGLRPTLSTPWQ